MQGQRNSHVVIQKREVENLSQKLLKAEDKFSNLKTELQHMKAMLREQTSLVEACQRSLSQIQREKEKVQENIFQDKITEAKEI